MGTTKASLRALAFLACLVALSTAALADPCTRKTASGSPFAVCFDSGNRLFLSGGSEGLGGGIRLRQAISFDDEPDLRWKLEHRLMEGSTGGLNNRFEALVYSGRFLRHARDGHIVLPLGVPRKIFVPFDIGGEAEVGRLRQSRLGALTELGVVRIAGLIDLSRSANFRRRLALGIAASWKMSIDAEERKVVDNQVSPLTQVTASGYMESSNGLTTAEALLSGGREWSSQGGWRWAGQARLSVERVLLALNDKPLSLVVEGQAKAHDRSFSALVGARFSLFAGR
jgi:hypothetical protein